MKNQLQLFFVINFVYIKNEAVVACAEHRQRAEITR